jgi:hypothetical protein
LNSGDKKKIFQKSDGGNLRQFAAGARGIF